MMIPILINIWFIGYNTHSTSDFYWLRVASITEFHLGLSSSRWPLLESSSGFSSFFRLLSVFSWGCDSHRACESPITYHALCDLHTIVNFPWDSLEIFPSLGGVFIWLGISRLLPQIFTVPNYLVLVTVALVSSISAFNESTGYYILYFPLNLTLSLRSFYLPYDFSMGSFESVIIVPPLY